MKHRTQHSKFLIIFLWLMSIHSICVGIALITFPIPLIAEFGIEICNKFFPTQSGVLHIIMGIIYILAIKNLDISIRARLGDSASVQKVIDNFHKSITDTILNIDQIRKWTEALFYINTDQTIEAFLTDLQEKRDLYQLEDEGDNLIIYNVFSLARILTDEYNRYYQRDLLYFEQYICKSPKYWNVDKNLI